MAIRTLLLGAVFALGLSDAALAQTNDHYVSGYTRSDGTYVQPHYQTNPNGTRDDNYSTQGNVNPYTGQPGTKPADDAYGRQPSWTTPTYGSQHQAPAYGDPYGAPNPNGSSGATPW